ncbi:DUF808 family protein, partial [Enterobacter asburiae]
MQRLVGSEICIRVRDDISVMGKLAAKKTAGVLGDDLSLNAQQVSG